MTSVVFRRYVSRRGFYRLLFNLFFCRKKKKAFGKLIRKVMYMYNCITLFLMKVSQEYMLFCYITSSATMCIVLNSLWSVYNYKLGHPFSHFCHILQQYYRKSYFCSQTLYSNATRESWLFQKFNAEANVRETVLVMHIY